MKELKEGFIKFIFKGNKHIGRLYQTEKDVWLIGCVDEEGWTRHLDVELVENIEQLNV